MARGFRLLSSAAGVALGCALWAASAGAADYGIAGQWNMNRGPTVNIPPGGGSVICQTAPGTVMAPCVRHDIVLPVALAKARGLKPLFGANGNTSVTGTSLSVPGHDLRLPAGFIQLNGHEVQPVPAEPAVVQLDTSFMFFAPKTSRTPVRPNQGNVIGPNQHLGTPNTRLMHANAWQDAGQNGRIGGNFVVSWTVPHAVVPTLTRTTMGAANPQTGTNFNPTTPGPFTRRVSYTAGPNAFGGTMGMMLSGVARVWAQAPITADPGNELIRSPVSGMGTQHPGRGYFTSVTRVAPPGKVYGSFMINFPCTAANPPAPAGCSAITVKGPFLFSLAGATTINFGFPWTTGRVVVQDDFLQGANPRKTTLSAVGGDSQVGGLRHLNLVAGGVALRTPSASARTRTSHVDNVEIVLPEPGVTLTLGAALAAVGVLYRARRRLFA